MTTQTVSESTPDTVLASESATELLTAMAALPAGHPTRARLRDRTIEAWLP
ncbi:RNA polymerase sigma factor SigF, partial [Asanoa sp. NPDC049573]